LNWEQFAAAAPELAAIGRERFTRRNVMMLGSLRADGTPRISPVNPYFAAGQLLFGAMLSAKATDLLRDERCTLHSAVVDGDGSEGEFKLFGRAVLVRDPRVRAAAAGSWWQEFAPDKAHVFACDIASATFISWDFAESTFETISWSAGASMRRQTRSYP
jgi:Pyridoxamine 5'-phosphate oxidase